MMRLGGLAWRSALRTTLPTGGVAAHKRGAATVLSHDVDATRSDAHAQVANALSLHNASRSEARRARKTHIIRRFAQAHNDTGSPQVQIALLTDRIRDCTQHVVQHKQDKMSRRRLIIMVAKRRRLMQYLLRTNSEAYMRLVNDLALRPNSVFPTDRPQGARKTATPRLH
eukprot:gb/GEZJ01002241.1/.p2 GENE.gb/GEZJ01002241.1/~~gb/GEZJ01002241.1/.p2  ORF type:complete len:170 (-),score=19.31 gb/GEZJ01002241.1/:796-1305(-)